MTDRPTDIMPPSDKGAEKAILGTALRDPIALADLMTMIEADDFYHFAHQKIWEALRHLSGKGHQIDVIVLGDRLNEMDCIADCGNLTYIQEIWDDAPALGNYKAYVEIVRGKALRRALGHAGQAIQRLTLDPALTEEELLVDAEKILFGITQRTHGGNGLVEMAKAIDDAIEAIDQRTRRSEGGDDDYLPTGLVDLDRLTGGLKRKELTVVGARPSVGKTLFCLNVIEHLAQLGKRIFFATLEQGAAELVERMLSRRTQISSYYFRTGTIPKHEHEKIHQASDVLRDYNLIFDERGDQSASRIASQARRLAMRGKLDLVAVDYLGMVEPEDRRRDQRYLQVGIICQRMKQLAKELNVPVMLLSQLNRACEGRRPTLSDLRESGDVEQNADCVLLLHRPEEPDSNPTQELEVLIRKQRNGPLGEAKLLHMKQFYELRTFTPEVKNDHF